MITIGKDSITCLGQNFYIPIGSIRVSQDINNRQFATIGLTELSQEDAQRTIFENANYYHYTDTKVDREKKLDLQAQILMLKNLGIELTPDEESQILGITKEDIEKQVAEIEKDTEKQQEQAKSKRIQEIRRWKMD